MIRNERALNVLSEVNVFEMRFALRRDNIWRALSCKYYFMTKNVFAMNNSGGKNPFSSVLLTKNKKRLPAFV